MSLQALVKEKREDILRSATEYGAYDVRTLGLSRVEKMTRKAI